MRFHTLAVSALALAIPMGLVHAQPTSTLVESYEFDSGAEGWTYASPPSFSTPASSVVGSELRVMTIDNSNSFGFWESPLLVGSTPPDRGIAGGTQIYRADYEIRSDQSDLSAVPTMRIRMTSEGFQHSSILVSTSQGAGEFSPGTSHRTYSQYLVLPFLLDTMRLDMDVLNFIPGNSANSLFALDRAEVHSLGGLPPPTAGTEVVSYDFTGGNANGFIPTTAAPLDGPFFNSSTGGLQIRGTTVANPTPSSVVFGYWRKDTNIEITGDRVYYIIFAISTDAPEAETNRVPAFRFRINDSSLVSSAYLNVESTPGILEIPPDGEQEFYALFFQSPPEIDGEDFYFSFDYIFSPTTDNDAERSIFLRELTIVELPVP